MPIKVDIVDNSSQVRIKPKSKDEVHVHGGCDTTGKVLNAKIDKEIADRKEADEELQRQIITKQDKIYFINLFDAEGTLSEDVLNLLISSRLNKLVYLDNIYSLSTKDNRYWRYMGQTTDPNMLNTIVVDTVTGEYVYSSIGNAVLQNHIADNNRHLREGEREFWNNKLNLEADDELLTFNRN